MDGAGGPERTRDSSKVTAPLHAGADFQSGAGRDAVSVRAQWGLGIHATLYHMITVGKGRKVKLF